MALWLDVPVDGPRREVARNLVRSVPDNGLILARDAARSWIEAVPGLWKKVQWLSRAPSAGWWAGDLREERGRYRFRIFHGNRFVLAAALQTPGVRHVESALATVAACSALGLSADELRPGLEEFRGISGDFESRGSYRGVTLIEDRGDDPEALRLGAEVGPSGSWTAQAVGRSLGASARSFRAGNQPSCERPGVGPRLASGHARSAWQGTGARFERSARVQCFAGGMGHTGPLRPGS